MVVKQSKVEQNFAAHTAQPSWVPGLWFEEMEIYPDMRD